MDQTSLLISPNAYNAWQVERVIETTAQAGETAAQAQTRSAVIIEMFKCLAPGDPVESMIACHCVELRFMSQAAMRDANNPALDPKTLKAMRASAMSISRTLQTWLTKLKAMQVQNEKRAVEMQRDQPGQAKEPEDERRARPRRPMVTPRTEPTLPLYTPPLPPDFAGFALDHVRAPPMQDTRPEETLPSLVPE
jgi:hypothetical protein